MLLTLAQAVAWVCERMLDAVNEIGREALEAQLRVAMQRWLQGHEVIVARRAVLDDEEYKPGRIEPVQLKTLASSQQAMNELVGAIWTKWLPLYVAQGGQYRILSDVEIAALELRIPNADGVGVGLWHKERGQFAHMDPMVRLSDLEALWPPKVVPITAVMENRIVAILLEKTADGRPIKKEDALAHVAEKLPGFGRRRFEAAWKRLPDDRKVGRGKRGPNRIRAG